MERGGGGGGEEVGVERRGGASVFVHAFVGYICASVSIR